MAKMKQLTRAGVRHVPEMQQLIRDFVCNVLFAGQSEPPRFDSRFWPSDKTVRNCIYSTRVKAAYVLLCGLFGFWLFSTVDYNLLNRFHIGNASYVVLLRALLASLQNCLQLFF